MTTKQIKALLTADLNRNIADLSEFNLLVKAAELNKWQLNKRILGSESRIKQLESILLPENFLPYCKLFITLQKSVAAIHSAMGAIKDNEMDGYHNPAYYPLLKMAGISQNAWFDMQKIKKEQSQS